MKIVVKRKLGTQGSGMDQSILDSLAIDLLERAGSKGTTACELHKKAPKATEKQVHDTLWRLQTSMKLKTRWTRVVPKCEWRAQELRYYAVDPEQVDEPELKPDFKKKEKKHESIIVRRR